MTKSTTFLFEARSSVRIETGTEQTLRKSLEKVDQMCFFINVKAAKKGGKTAFLCFQKHLL